MLRRLWPFAETSQEIENQFEFGLAWRYFNDMGKTYHFECPLCHYRVKISGGSDSGLHCEVQTVVCRDCRELYDVFTRVRRRAGEVESGTAKFPGFFRPEVPPAILQESSFNPQSGEKRRLVWREYAPACLVNPKHSVEAWNHPGRCPRCGNFIEKNEFPYRLWD